MATQFAITLSQALQNNHIINAVLINLLSFSSLLRNVLFIHSPKLMCYIWNWTQPRKLTAYNGKLETYRNNTEIWVIMSHLAVLKHYGEISIRYFLPRVHHTRVAAVFNYTSKQLFFNCAQSRYYHTSKNSAKMCSTLKKVQPHS